MRTGSLIPRRLTTITSKLFRNLTIRTESLFFIIRVIESVGSILICCSPSGKPQILNKQPIHSIENILLSIQYIMSVVDHKRIVFFNSNSSTSYIQEPTSLKCNLDPSIFQIENRELYYRFYISSLIFRNDFNDVNTKNNVLIYNGTTIYLPTGKPGIQDILDFLGTNGIVATYEPETNYITFHTASSYTLDFTDVNNCANLLGFASGSVNTITDGYTPVNQIDLILETVFITSNYCQNNYTVVQDQTQYTNILGSVSILAQPFQTLEFVDPVGQYSMIEKNRKDINSIEVSFVALNGTPLTLNSNFTCALTIEYIYDPHVDLIKELQMLNTTLTNMFNFQKRTEMLRHLKAKPTPKTIKAKK